MVQVVGLGGGKEGSAPRRPRRSVEKGIPPWAEGAEDIGERLAHVPHRAGARMDPRPHVHQDQLPGAIRAK